MHGGPAVGRGAAAHPRAELRAHEVVPGLRQVLEAVVHHGVEHQLLDVREVLEAAVLLQVVEDAAVEARVADKREDVLDLLLVRQVVALHVVGGRHQDEILLHVAAVAGDERAHRPDPAAEPALRAHQLPELAAQQAVGRLLHVPLVSLVFVEVAHHLQAEPAAGVGRRVGVGGGQKRVGRAVVVVDDVVVVAATVAVVVVVVVVVLGAVVRG